MHKVSRDKWVVSYNSQQSDQAARLAGLVGQIGCVTGFASIIVIAIAFAAGRFLDNILGTEPVFTILFLVGSFPITLYVIVRISLAALARTQRRLASEPVPDQSEGAATEEEPER